MSLEQLNNARELVRANPEQFPTLVRGILKVGDRPEPEIRAWCAGFVADFFGSEMVSSSDKNSVIEETLPLLTTWIRDESNAPCAKLGICILCEIYPRVYEKTANDGNSMKTIWDIIQVLKNITLARWQDKTPMSVKVMCIKLAQVVVSTHQKPLKQRENVMDTVTLTAEAAGLLDRLISVFGASTAIEFDELSASLNASIAVALAFPALAPRVVSSVLTFNVAQRTVATPEQLPLVLRWTNKLFKLALHPLQRSFPHIQVFLAGLTSYCTSQALKRPAREMTDEDNRVDKTDRDNDSSEAKRAKTDADVLPAGNQPYKALYTLSNDLANVDARSLQLDLAVAIAVAGLQKISSENLESMIAKIRKRLESIKPTETANTPPPDAPANVTTESSSQVTASTQSVDEQSNDEEPEEVHKGPSRAALEIEVPSELKKYDAILNRLLTDAPVRVVARLSARGLGNGTDVKEFTQKKLYAELVSDFRKTLDPLVLWLSEEYYADETRKVYFNLVARVVDEIIPKLEVSDSKIFVRLLSELPELNRDIIFKIKSSCLDPERSVVGARALKFLIMFKPPCRDDCLDLVEELTKEGVQSVRGILEKFRPPDASS